jgi:8-oxo-dGTP pyrophosphatase MutT (NUDIX family)
MTLNTKPFNFLDTKSPRPDSAGIAIVLNGKYPYPNKILLVHPTNASWVKRTYGIPKGMLEKDEEPFDAALRETFEETGIRIRPDQVEKEIHTSAVYYNNIFRYNIFYLICRINDVSEIGLETDRVPNYQLQLDEVDWAGFVDVNEAYSKVPESHRIILDRIR